MLRLRPPSSSRCYSNGEKKTEIFADMVAVAMSYATMSRMIVVQWMCLGVALYPIGLTANAYRAQLTIHWVPERRCMHESKAGFDAYSPRGRMTILCSKRGGREG